ncbi:MAG: DUF5069 domain-containing protein [Verrucomicrobiales bacterium]|jgi:hypothetical protein|nr:DUF5069 domain-containing protein [Verrucomicrobiales bacterium]
MSDYDWTVKFGALFDKAVKQYQAGARGAKNFFTAEDEQFLAGIGHTAQEMYDFAEDAANGGEPDAGTVLLLAAARRDYFWYVQQGRRTGRELPSASLPAKTAAVDGIEWLPRIIEKARRKLAGEMDADLMFDCGGDRAFLRRFDIHPADFLRLVWAAGDDDRKVIEWVKGRAK